MWILFAFASAFFAGVTCILAKIGIKHTDSNVATAIRTVIVLIFSSLMVFISGSQGTIADILPKTWLFLILSGCATGASWLCYFKALQLGDINKVVPIDKSSIILTILLAFIFLGESMTLIKLFSIILLAVGTFLMIQKKEDSIKVKDKNISWIVYATFSAIFASLTAILGKVGINGVESNLGTAIRTFIVLIMSIVIVFVTKKNHDIKKISKNELGFICLSGIATGASWLFYYRALKDGVTSIVVAVDKLSILITIFFSYIIFKEKLNLKSSIGLILITVGTLGMLFK